MANIFIKTNEATAARRRVYFHCVDATDGITPETEEAAGQPQISVDGASWTNTGIGTLIAIGNGRYYADITQATVDVANAVICTRYKSANTAEAVGDTVIVDVRLDRLDATVSSRSTYAGGAVASVTGAVGSVTGAVGSVTAEVSANVTKISGDVTAADNAEAFFDGTGYAGTNNVIPTVTTVGTTTNLTNLPAAVATAAELAKVPKSDGVVSWNATALAAVAVAFLDSLLSAGDSDALNARTVRSALRVLRNMVDLDTDPGTMHVKKENDSDDAWTAPVTTDASADPITKIDPA